MTDRPASREALASKNNMSMSFDKSTRVTSRRSDSRVKCITKEIHTATKRFCHYYNNSKPCPYEAIGCMFHHSKSGVCKQLICANILCQFEHPKLVIVEKEAENVIEDISNEDIAENDCHLCTAKFENLEPLCDHLLTEHLDYNQGVLRGLANMEA